MRKLNVALFLGLVVSLANVPAMAVGLDTLGLDPALKACIDSTGATDSSQVTSIDCGFAGVNSLSGVDQLTNLDTLWIAGNNISDLSPLSGLPNLVNLDVNQNQVTTLPTLPSTLGYLNIGNNPLTDISGVYSMSGLTYLNVDWLPPGVVDPSMIGTMTNLTDLEYRGSGLDSLSYFSSMSNLQNLVVEDGTITDLSPISGLSLSNLSVRNNLVSDLSPLSSMTSLAGLDASDNMLASLAGLGTLTNLQYLRVENNGIADVSPISGISSLTSLSIFNNLIANDDGVLSSMSQVTDLQADSPGRPTLSAVFVSPTAIMDPPVNIKTRVDGSFSGNACVNLNHGNAGFGNCQPAGQQGQFWIGGSVPAGSWKVSVGLDSGWQYNAGMLNALGFTGVITVQYSNGSMGDSSQVTLNGFSVSPATVNVDNGPQTVTFNIDVGSNSPINWMEVQLDSPDGSVSRWVNGNFQNGKLKTVFSGADVRGDWIINHVSVSSDSGVGFWYDTSALTQRGLPASVNVGGTATPAPTPISGLTFPSSELQQCVADTGVQNVEDLTWLNCSWRNISDLTGLDQLFNLTGIDFNNNPISDISVLANLPLLRDVYINNTQVSSLTPLQGNIDQVTSLNIANTAVSDFSLAFQAVSLSWLGVDNLPGVDLNQIASAFPRLTGLSAGQTGIMDISPLAQLRYLNNLSLWGNGITDLSPLENLRILDSLYLDQNRISDLTPLSGLVDLHTLSVNGNLLTSLAPIVDLPLNSLTIGNNPIMDIPAFSHPEMMNELQLDGTLVTDANQLAQFSNLQGLNIGENGFTDLTPIAGLPLGSYLNVTNNLIDPSQLDSFYNRGVNVNDYQPGYKPSISQVTIDPASVNLDNGDQQVNIQVALSGNANVSGVNYYCIHLKNPGNAGEIFVGCPDVTNPGVMQITIPASAPRGTWLLTVDGQTSDYNNFNLAAGAFKAQGFAYSVDVGGTGLGDFTRPEINNFALGASTVDVSLGASLNVNVNVTDNDNLTFVEVTACSDTSGECQTGPANPGGAGGDLTLSVYLPSSSAQGAWHIDHIYAQDAGGNGNWIDGNGLSSMGYATTFDVVAPGLADDDGDGFNNAQEAAQGTDPNNSASYPGVAGVASLEAGIVSVDENQGTATVYVDRMLSTTGALTVDYQTADGLAKAGTDYSATSGQVTWADGDKSRKAIQIPIIDDNGNPTGSRSFNVRLSNATSGGLIGNDDTNVTIVESDISSDGNPYGGSIILATFYVTVEEDAGVAHIDLMRVGGSAGAVTANYAIDPNPENGWQDTATPGADYEQVSGSVTWADGDTARKTVDIPIYDDADPESTEIINRFHLTSASGDYGNALDEKGFNSATIDIVDDDQPDGAGMIGSIDVAGPTVEEEAGMIHVPIVRLYGAHGDITVNWNTAQGGATAGEDFPYTSGTLHWSDGDMTPKYLDIPIYDDSNWEGIESLVYVMYGINGSNGPGYLRGQRGGFTVGYPLIGDNQDNPALTTDTDSDGVLDIVDIDADNDGVRNIDDAFPYDASEQVDSDGDGIGDNADTDDDNDGVPDNLDAAPLDNTVGAFTPLTGGDVQQTYVGVVDSAVDYPGIANFYKNGDTYSFNTDGTGLAINDSGSVPFTWSIDGKGAIAIQYQPSPNDAQSGYPLASDLPGLGLASQSAVDTFIAAHGNIQVEVTTVPSQETLYQLSLNGEDVQFYSTATVSKQIVDDTFRTELTGDISTPAVQVDVTNQGHYVLLAASTPISADKGTATPWSAKYVALTVAVDQAATPGRRFNGDIVQFNSDGTGQLLLTQQTLTWQLDANGSVVLTMDATGTMVTVTQYQAFGNGMVVYSHAVATDGEEYTSVNIGAIDTIANAVDPTAFTADLYDNFLISGFFVTDPNSRDQNGNILIRNVFGYQLHADGTATRVWTANPAAPGIDTWYWHQNANGELVLEARYDSSTGTYYSSCDPSAAPTTCMVFRERHWQPLDWDGDRLYVIESEMYTGTFDPADPQYYASIAPRVAFYEHYSQDLDGDNINDVDEVLAGLNPYAADTDTDGDGIPDAVDTDDDNDGVPDDQDIAPLNPAAGAYTQVAAGDVGTTYVNVVPGFIQDPSFAVGYKKGATHEFNQDGTGFYVNNSGSMPFTWSIDAKGGVDIVYQPEANDAQSTYLYASDLVQLGMTDQSSADSFVATNGDIQIEVSTVPKETHWYLLGIDGDTQTYWSTSIDTYSIVDDTFRTQLTGDVNSLPVDAYSEGRVTQVLTDNITPTSADTGAGTPWGAHYIAVTTDVEEANDPGRRFNTDLVEFLSGGTGQLVYSGQPITWQYDTNGSVVISVTNTGATVTLSQYEAFAGSYGIYSRGVAASGEQFADYNFGVVDNISESADPTSFIGDLQDNFLISSFMVTGPGYHDANGLIILGYVFGYELHPDGTATRVWDADPNDPGPGTDPWFWHQNPDGEIVLEARLDQSNGWNFYSTCDPQTAPSTCMVFRERHWKPLNWDGSRLYVIESEMWTGSYNPADPQYYLAIAPRVSFYEHYSQDIDLDGVSDVDEFLAGSNPYQGTSLDSDGDGVPDSIDTDDDNDGVPDTQDAAPLDPTVGAYISLTAGAIEPSYVNVLDGAIDDPGFATGVVEGSTYDFNSDGSGVFAGQFGSTPFTWAIDGAGSVTLQYQSDASDAQTSYPTVSQLQANGTITADAAQTYIANHGDVQIEVTNTPLRETWFLLADNVDNQEFYVDSTFTQAINDDATRTELTGDVNTPPAEVTQGYTTKQELPSKAIPVNADIGASTPWGAQYVALKVDVQPGADRFGRFNGDIVQFQSGGTGQLVRTSQPITWAYDSNGGVVITVTATGTIITLTQYDTYSQSLGIYARAVTTSGEQFAAFEEGVVDTFQTAADPTAYVSDLMDSFMANSSTFTRPVFRDQNGNIIVDNVFGYELHADGTADRGLGYYHDKWYWSQNPNGEIVLTARLDLATGQAYSSCDPQASPDTCMVFRERHWMPVRWDGNRLYLIESEMYAGNYSPTDPQFYQLIAPRVVFYQRYTQDLDGDSFNDAQETLWGTDPFTPDVDSDGDGIPDAADNDLDNDGVPNDQDANPNDPSVGAFITLTSLPSAYINLPGPSAVAEPDFSMAYQGGDVLAFTPNQMGTVTNSESVSPITWTLMPNGSLHIEWGSQPESMTWPYASQLVDMGIATQAAVDAYIAAHGDMQIQIGQTPISADWYLTQDGPSIDEFYKRGTSSYRIVNDADRAELLGDINAGPVVTSGKGGDYATDMDVDNTGNYPFSVAAPAHYTMWMALPNGNFARQIDLNSDGTGTVMPDGLQVQWHENVDGVLVITDPVSGIENHFTIYRKYSEGFAVETQAYSPTGEQAASYTLGMMGQGTTDISGMVDQFLLSSLTLTEPSYRDQNGNIGLNWVFGYKLMSDGHAIRVTDATPTGSGPAYAATYFWSQDPTTGEVTIEGRWDSANNITEADCDTATNSACVVYRKRHWMPIMVTPERVYVVEWAEFTSTWNPADMQLQTFIAPRVNFYALFPQDQDGDGASDIDEVFAGSDPYSGGVDTDGDGIIDAIDPDDDNDGIPDTYEIAHGMDPLVYNCGTDTDSDGVDDCTEYQYGTDPTDGTSVPDTEAPVLNLPADITVEIVSGTGGGVYATNSDIVTFLGAATANDNIDGSVSVSNDAPGFFPLGTTPVTFRALDSTGNEATGTASVTVVDNRPQQLVYSLDTVAAAPGGHVALPVIYTTSDTNASLTGALVRVHFNSSLLTWTGFSNVFTTGKSAEDTQPQPDVDDLDNDPNTDYYVAIAWADLNGSWPGTLPQNLFTVEFDVSSSIALGDSTNVNFSSDQTPAGYGFSGTPVQVVAGLTLDIDGNGQAKALSDGLLILRHEFGFSGSSLFNGAVAPDATRTQQEMSDYLAQADQATLDIDGNGQVSALTDGLLVLRRLFGFSGSTLISGAVEADCTRCDAPTIQTQIDGLKP